jgi:2-polyprenyl-6-methoxyphenol hydroxylase-like FAD-dependent oxidoreductase
MVASFGTTARRSLGNCELKRNERVLIIGGGIAGLSVAAGLRRLGIAPTLVEQAPQFGAVGAGIVLNLNAMAMMRKLGLDEAVRDAGMLLSRGEITDVRGRRLSQIDFDALGVGQNQTVTIHRAALHEVLLSGCRDLPLLSGTTVETLMDRGEVVDVGLSDGQTVEFDCVIGADGIRSRTREQVFGLTEPTYAGYTCWRFVVARPPGLDRMQEMWGRGLRFGLVPLAEDRLYCFTCANVPEASLDPEDGRVDRFRRRFAGFGGFAPAALEQITTPDQLIHNDIADLPKHPWYKGRVLLIGDAAHATTPNMGQGAAMAIEDAAVLCEMLAPGDSWADLMPKFSARREPRVRFIVDQSRRIGRIGQIENPTLASIRDWVTRVTPSRFTAAGVSRVVSAEI